MMYWIRQDFIEYHQHQSSLFDESNGESREIQIVLYSRVTDSVFSKTIGKKPLVKIYDSRTNQEIKKSQWSAPLRVHIDQTIKQHPVPHVGIKWKLFSKIFFTLAGLLIIFASISIIYTLFIQMPQNSNNQALFLQAPDSGDRYFGSIHGGSFYAGGTLKKAWIKVIDMNPADSIGHIVLSKDISEYTDEPKSKDYQNFEQEEIQVKFQVNKNSIIFNALEKDLTIECSVIGDKYDEFKIPSAGK